MTTLQNPPLIEAIFVLRWGEVAPGQFIYTPDEQTLFIGKMSASATSKGYGVTENIQQHQSFIIPGLLTHRFRKQENSHPCFQVGLGVFTVNQTKEDYNWYSFKEAIETGLEIYNTAEPTKLNDIKDTLSLSLHYQDAFFPENNITTEEYLKQYFHINAGLPESFFEKPEINRSKIDINMAINVETLNPKGIINVNIANAIINDQSGLLMQTTVQSKAKDDFNGEVCINEIMNWLELAHDLQKHSFEILVKSSAYK
jgi:uncharacterized protein (TIGR04255 family)